MSISGFPSERELSDMFGYVTQEDREKWDKESEAADQRRERARNGLSARGLASNAVAPIISQAENVMNRQMSATLVEEKRNTLGKQSKRTITTIESEQPLQSDSHEMGF